MRIVVACFVFLFTLSSCASESDVSLESQRNDVSAPDVDLLRNTVAYSFKPFETVSQMLAAVDVAVIGKIVSVDMAMVGDESEPSGAAIVGIEPTREIKRAFGNAGDIVYYWIDRPANLGQEVYGDALPIGTEVVLFGLEIASTSDTRFLTPAPDLVFAPVPQGLFLSAPGDPLVNVWGEDGTGWSGLDSPEEVTRAATEGGE